MASINKVILIGTVGKDLELKCTKSGPAIVNISLATNEIKKDGEKSTEWHRVVCFGKTAENCAKYLAKGSSVYIEGKLQTSSWEDDKGVKRYSTDILANQVQFLTKAKDKPQAESQPQANDDPYGLNDIPF